MNEPVPRIARIGDYEVLAELNTGGMGEVLLARRIGIHNFEKLVAIKTLREDLADNNSLRIMFHDEARLVARIDHPAVAQVYDFGEDANLLYLVMEYIPGISFRKLIKRKPGHFISARAMAEICHGLHAAHELKDFSGKPLGVVHRDASPENLMLTFSGRVKILDFGIALMRDRETHATMLGQIKGKPAYMAPEQVTNKTIDRRTDVFIASIVLHELLTGSRLFVGDTLLATAMAVGNAKVEPPSKYVRSVPAALDEIVMKGLERDPANRFQTALEMAKALELVVASDLGEDLAHYAARELCEDREKHFEWLRNTLAQRETIPPKIDGRFEGAPSKPADSPESQDVLDDLKTREIRNVKAPPRKEAKSTETKQNRMRKAIVSIGVAAALAAFFVYISFFSKVPSPNSSVRPIDTVSERVPAKQEKVPPPAAVIPKENPEAPELQAEPQEPEESKAPTPTKTAPMRPKIGPRSEEKKTSVDQAKTNAAGVEEWGYINVDANPYAMVHIDGKQIGTTPVLRYKVPVGEHTIVLMEPDDGEIRSTRTVQVSANEVESVILR